MPEPSQPARLLRRATAWLLAWAFTAALYLLLIDNTALPELIVGVCAATLSATGFELAREQDIAHVATRLGWLRRLPRPLTRVPSDIAIVSWSALRQLVRPRRTRGRFRTVRFRCGDEEALETARGALAEAFGSFAPNTIVVGIDADRDLMLAHQLHRAGGPEAIDLLRLG
jgi:hypothetical protein